jgi:hypothetical protein
MWRIAPLFAATLLCAQIDRVPVPRAPVAPFTISGSVVNSVTGEPLARALVHVSTGASVLTDALGAFRISGISGRFITVEAGRPGFETAGNPTSFNLDADKTGLALRLSPLAVIEGSISDPDGAPISKAHIVLLHTQIENGFRRTVEDRNVDTDDRGHYRLWNLRPGAYYLKTTGRPSALASLASLYRQTIEEPTYYGGGRDLASAHPFTVKAGDNIHAGITVSMRPAVHVRGVVTGRPNRLRPWFTLLAGDEQIGFSTFNFDQDTGVFDIVGVLPGSWTLRASLGTEFRGETQITVGNSDLDGVTLAPNPPVDLSWSARLITSPRPAFCAVQLHPSAPEVNAKEQVFHGLFPGVYIPEVRCDSSYIAAASWGTQNLLLDPQIRIEAGSSPSPILIEARRGGGKLSGSFPTLSGDPPWTAALLVPKFSGFPLVSNSMNAAGAGAYRIDYIAPGDYTLYAVANINELEYRNPQVLKSLTGGAAIHIEDGQETKYDLTKFDIGGAP